MALCIEHPDVAESLFNLACLYSTQGRFKEAISLHERALAVREKSLGTEHVAVADSLDRLGKLYVISANVDKLNVDKLAEAKRCHERALAIRKKTFGTDHPQMAESLEGVAFVHLLQDKDTEAESLRLRALEILEKTLGPEHPETVKSLAKLAEHYRIMNRGKAVQRYKQLLAIEEKRLRPDHSVGICPVFS